MPSLPAAPLALDAPDAPDGPPSRTTAHGPGAVGPESGPAGLIDLRLEASPHDRGSEADDTEAEGWDLCAVAHGLRALETLEEALRQASGLQRVRVLVERGESDGPIGVALGGRDIRMLPAHDDRAGAQALAAVLRLLDSWHDSMVGTGLDDLARLVEDACELVVTTVRGDTLAAANDLALAALADARVLARARGLGAGLRPPTALEHGLDPPAPTRTRRHRADGAPPAA